MIIPIILSLLLSSCIFQDRYHYTFEVTHIDDLESALHAAAEWNQCGVVNITITTEYDSDAIQLIYVPDLSVSGVAFENVIEYRHTPHTYSVLAHEMGHQMGLSHGDGIMSDNQTSLDVTPADCDALRYRQYFRLNDT